MLSICYAAAFTPFIYNTRPDYVHVVVVAAAVVVVVVIVVAAVLM
jgi:hypothetical protein